MTERQYKTTPPMQADKTTPPVSNTPADQPDVVQLQRLLGNQGVQRLLAKGSGTRIQAKLSVNAPGDKFEAEADKVSKEVARMPYGVQRAGPEDELQMARTNDIQRAGEEEELQLSRADIQRAGEEEELQLARADIQRVGEEDELQLARADVQREGPEDELQMSRIQRTSSEADGGFEVGGEIESTIQAQRGSGDSMGNQTRGFFESGFGADFGNVKVHNDATADNLNQSVSARAFTIGSDIFFRSGEYQPDTQDGRELMAHELTHVVQQGGANVKKDEKKD